jgi:hypothetical protein
VQPPVGLDELGQGQVFRDRRVAELLTTNALGLERDRVAFSVERAGALMAALVARRRPRVRVASALALGLVLGDLERLFG